ncbi:MAG: LL-diaminopimelate aminotransferase [Bacillota bacterium]
MAILNDNFRKVKESYLFSTIARKVNEFKAANPEADVIRLGIGDVTNPLPQVCTDAMHKAVDEMATREGFHGYGPEQGYDFLREAIAKHDYQARGANIQADEVFVSDGAKSDTANFTDMFGGGNVIGIPDPVYPVYLDSNILAGNIDAIQYIGCSAATGFAPPVPPTAAEGKGHAGGDIAAAGEQRMDIIYLCSPNNPTGSALNRAQLTAWVEYARAQNAIILFDSAYEAYISDPDIPHSIYEIDGARSVAVEFRSYSKTAGFTGTRCSYSVVPKDIQATFADGAQANLHAMWNRRQSTKFNGAPYVIQKAAEALYTDAGRAEVAALVGYYMENANAIRKCFEDKGYEVFGGINAPYVWLKTPNNLSSWEFFDFMLENCHVVGTPGSGFGENGEGYFRLTGFGSKENTAEAIRRISKI